MHKLSQRLWIGTMTLIISIIALVWFFQIVLLREFYTKERQEVLLDKASQLAEHLSLWDQNSEPPAEVPSIANDLLTTYDTRMILLDSQDRVVIHKSFLSDEMRIIGVEELSKRAASFENTNSELPPMDKNMANILQRAISRSKTASTISMPESSMPQMRAMMVTEPIYLGSIYKGKVVLFMPMAPIDETASILKRQLTTISFASLLLGSLIALFLSKSFTKPILQIREATKQIAAGNFKIDLPIDSKDEVGALAHDIQDMVTQLDAIDQRRKDFVSNVSHDLKTPITLIQTYSEFLIEKSSELSEFDKESILVIQNEAQRLDHIVDDLLYLSRIEPENAVMNYESHSLNELVENTAKSMSCMLQNGVSINIEKYGSEQSVVIDRQKIERVLYNLIHNAIDHADGLTSITVKLLYKRDSFTLEVIDDGQGIQEDDLPHVWERFYRGDKSRKSHDHSTVPHSGIGMSIVRQILINHNYDFGIESKVGLGTTVWFQGRYN